MKRFIAGALGHDDGDEIRDRALRPVLRELRVQPERIDRAEYNEDIDDGILQLIDESQLCVADLTYARPSAYYETGCVFGNGKPVVHIYRSDRFRMQGEDIHGNLRIHFDLPMKNIIL